MTRRIGFMQGLVQRMRRQEPEHEVVWNGSKQGKPQPVKILTFRETFDLPRDREYWRRRRQILKQLEE